MQTGFAVLESVAADDQMIIAGFEIEELEMAGAVGSGGVSGWRRLAGFGVGNLVEAKRYVGFADGFAGGGIDGGAFQGCLFDRRRCGLAE